MELKQESLQVYQKEDSKYRKKILGSSMLGLGLESMDIMFLSFVLSTIIAEFGISSAAGGSIASITNIDMLLGGLYSVF